ncbi:MAG: T9SS type A sorting domain-containing protein [Bacteroidales bacterium]|nr:T9SS type A sorting domain-containing protein [Bacteroidales bacterium]
MKRKYILTLIVLLINGFLLAQTSYYGMTKEGGSGKAGTIFKTDATGSNLQTVFNFEYENAGKGPKSVFTQASNGKIYGTTQFGGNNVSMFPYYSNQRNSGVLFEYDPVTDNYTDLFHFDDTVSGCWPETAPVQAANGKLYGLVRGGGSSHNYGCVYSYDLATSTYTKIHAFLGSYASVGYDGVQPIGNLLLASDGKLYGITSGGGYNGHGVIYKIDPITNTYTKLLDMQISSSGANAGYDAKSGLVQAPNGKMYGTTQSGGSSYNGNIFEYNPITNVATSLHEFTDDSLGVYPYGSLTLVGNDSLYCVTYKYYTAPGASWPNIPHFYLWRYQISTGNAIVVDSIANGSFTQELTLTSNAKILMSGYDHNNSTKLHFWEFNPATRTRVFLDSALDITNTKGLMQATNGKFYGGFSYKAPGSIYSNSDGTFVEYDPSNHQIVRKFNWSDPINGVLPEGDLIMATNGKFYGMTPEGGQNNKGVVFEFNPSTDTYVKKFDLDSFSGYEPKGGLMEASNGKLYGLTTRGGNNGLGSVFEIDTLTWTLSKKADFSNSIGVKPLGRMVEAWDGKLYGLTAWNSGAIFQYDISTSTLTNKHSFTYNDGTSPYGSLAIADNGNLYGITSYGGASYYSHGTLFEYNPTTSLFTMKKELYNYTGYNSQGNTPLLGSDGIMYVLLSCGGNGNTQYAGGAINEYVPGATSITNKASFSVASNGSKPMGDLMESANGNFYGYTWIGGLNNKGTVFEYNPVTAVITAKTTFSGSNGANPTHGSLTESNPAAITISQQPIISTVCIGDTAYLSISASHATLLHYQWFKNGVRIAGSTNDTLVFNGLLASDAANYSCKITGGTKAIVSSSFTLTPSPKPIVNITGLSNAYCANDADVTLSANPSGGVFSGTGVSGSIFSPSAVGSGSHDIVYSYTNTQGCANADTVNVSINILPDASFTGYATSYCDNDEMDTLIPTTIGGSFSGSGLTNDVFDPNYFASSSAIAGFPQFVYTITDANGCINKDTVTSVIHHAPTVTLTGLNSTYCSNDAIDTLITSPSGGTISAGSFLVGNIFTPSNASIGNNDIYYSFVNSFACSNSDTLQIIVNGIPDASFTGLDNSYCVNNDADTMIATTVGGVFSGDIVNGNIFNPQLTTIPGGALSVLQQVIYTLTDNNACTDIDTITTIVYPLPSVDFGTIASSFCDNNASVSLVNGTPTGGVYSGNGIVGNTFDPSAAGLGLDTLVYTFTNSNSCTNMDTAYTIIYPAPDFHLSSDTNICINNVLTLSTGLSAAYTFLWSDGSTNQTLTINAATVGVGTFTYSVVVKNTQSDCEETDEIIVTINACTGFEDNLDRADGIKVYPIPSEGLFTIETTQNIEEIEVYSSEGKLVFSNSIQSQNQLTKIDLRDHAPGVYYLLINDGSSIIRKQLIIK